MEGVGEGEADDGDGAEGEDDGRREEGGGL